MISNASSTQPVDQSLTFRFVPRGIKASRVSRVLSSKIDERAQPILSHPPFYNLPQDVTNIIFSKLRTKDLLVLRRTGRELFNRVFHFARKYMPWEDCLQPLEKMQDNSSQIAEIKKLLNRLPDACHLDVHQPTCDFKAEILSQVFSKLTLPSQIFLLLNLLNSKLGSQYIQGLFSRFFLKLNSSYPIAFIFSCFEKLNCLSSEGKGLQSKKALFDYSAGKIEKYLKYDDKEDQDNQFIANFTFNLDPLLAIDSYLVVDYLPLDLSILLVYQLRRLIDNEIEDDCATVLNISTSEVFQRHGLRISSLFLAFAEQPINRPLSLKFLEVIEIDFEEEVNALTSLIAQKWLKEISFHLKCSIKYGEIIEEAILRRKKIDPLFKSSCRTLYSRLVETRI